MDDETQEVVSLSMNLSRSLNEGGVPKEDVKMRVGE